MNTQLVSLLFWFIKQQYMRHSENPYIQYRFLLKWLVMRILVPHLLFQQIQCSRYEKKTKTAHTEK